MRKPPSYSRKEYSHHLRKVSKMIENKQDHQPLCQETNPKQQPMNFTKFAIILFGLSIVQLCSYCLGFATVAQSIDRLAYQFLGAFVVYTLSKEPSCVKLPASIVQNTPNT